MISQHFNAVILEFGSMWKPSFLACRALHNTQHDPSAQRDLSWRDSIYLHVLLSAFDASSKVGYRSLMSLRSWLSYSLLSNVRNALQLAHLLTMDGCCHRWVCSWNIVFSKSEWCSYCFLPSVVFCSFLCVRGQTERVSCNFNNTEPETSGGSASGDETFNNNPLPQ